MLSSDTVKQGSEWVQGLKLKATLCIVSVHLGLAAFVAAMVSGGLRGQLEATTLTFWLLLASVAMMYGAFLYAVLSIWLPIKPWLARYRRAQAWREWILLELPTLLALVPVLVSALHILREAWQDIKGMKSEGELNVANFSKVARKFAESAEGLTRDPAVQSAKSALDGVPGAKRKASGPLARSDDDHD